MLIRHTQYEDGSIIALWQMTETAEDFFVMLGETSVEQEIKHISAEKRRREKLSVRLLLKTVLGKLPTIVYDTHGAPSLADNSYHISISHCKNFAAIMLHPTKRTGIDIEQIHPRIESLAHKFLSPQEAQNIPHPYSIKELLVYWCAKETLFKLIPENEIHFAEQLHITPFLLQEKGTISACETRTERQESFTLHYETGQDFVMVFGTADNLPSR
jgi:phosphopantetheinyl transferase